MARTRLSDEEISKRLESLAGWHRDGHKIVREFKFADFVDAFAWMTSAALIAEKLDHHPDWKNVYNRVSVELNTHDAGGITELDFALGTHMNELAARYRL